MIQIVEEADRVLDLKVTGAGVGRRLTTRTRVSIRQSVVGFALFFLSFLATSTFCKSSSDVLDDIGPGLEKESEIVLANFDLVAETSVRHLELLVVPSDHVALSEVFVYIERADFVLDRLAQFLSTFEVPY